MTPAPDPCRESDACMCAPCYARRYNPVVIIACGDAKKPSEAPAADLYLGQHFRAARAAALSVALRGRCFVLSARYGLVGFDEVIAPYDLTIGQPGAVTAPMVAADARRLGIDRAPAVMVLAPRRYADLCRPTWPHLTAPLDGLGIGYQRAVLSSIRRAGAAA